MTAGKAIAAIIGSLLALVALGLLIGGGTLLWAHHSMRNADGFFTSPSYRLETEGYAIVARDIDLASHPGDWWPSDVAATVRLSARSSRGDDVFIGIAPEQDVDSYLSQVSHSVVRDFGERWDDVRITSRRGDAPQGTPESLDFWTSYAQGVGEQTLTWQLAPGRWSVVVMNASAEAGVEVSAVAGVRLPILYPISLGLLAAGIVLAALASLLLLAATRSSERRDLASAPVARGTYPASATGSLDGVLSPVLWLVKWFLAIPHYIVLAFLWAAFCILTFFAWIAILVTGRYPRGIFDFNVGVMRWTWRVGFYAYSCLATDRYPPFTLRDVEYPARFNVAYPETVSRGFALVKWWLLALPHYVIVGIFTSGMWTWAFNDTLGEGSLIEVGGGLILILSIVSGFVLLFTGRYPRGMFDFLMGLNRWVLRVASYVALMHDDYPPFRLDMGGEEPSSQKT